MSSLPKTMKAATVVKHKEPLQLLDMEVPVPQRGQVLVKVLMSGVCHTDVHVADGDWSSDVPCPLPIVPGHEGCGIVAAVGENVTRVKVGDRVGVPWLHTACGSCFDCNDGWETVCGSSKATGFMVNGGLAEYVLADAAFVGIIPDNLDLVQAAPILCAGVTVYKALKTSNVKPGQWVVITGAAGGLGHVCCQYAKAMGMRVVAITRKMTPQKEQMFKSYGVDYCLDMSYESSVEGVKKATGGTGASGAIMLAPSNKDITDAIVYLRARGTVVPVAIPPGNFEASTFLTTVRAIRIAGSIVGTRNDLEEALDFAARGKVKCDVTVRKLEDANEVMNDLREGKISGRVVIKVADA